MQFDNDIFLFWPLARSYVVVLFSKFFNCTTRSRNIGIMNNEINMFMLRTVNWIILSVFFCGFNLHLNICWWMESGRVSYSMPNIAHEPIMNRPITSSTIKRTNLIILCFPTQLLIHVQWWSYCSIQTLHMSQWYPLRGFLRQHSKHILSVL